MPTLAQLQATRSALIEARSNGIREVRDSDGSAVSYKSDREMASALAALDSEIAALANGRRSSILRFSTSKGL